LIRAHGSWREQISGLRTEADRQHHHCSLVVVLLQFWALAAQVMRVVIFRRTIADRRFTAQKRLPAKLPAVLKLDRLPS